MMDKIDCMVPTCLLLISIVIEERESLISIMIKEMDSESTELYTLYLSSQERHASQ